MDKKFKKRTRNVLSKALLLTLLCLFTACPDSPHHENELTTSTLMQKKWVNHDTEFNGYDTWLEYVENIWSFFFTSENEGVLIALYKWIDSSGISDQGHDISGIFFTYTISGNTVTCKMEDGNTYRFSYEDGNLTMNAKVFEPITIVTSDREQIAQLQQERQYKGNYEMEYQIGFDPKYYHSIYNTKTKTYEHHVFMGFGVNKNTYMRGIRNFGIALQTPDGTIDNKDGSTSSDARVTVRNINNQSTKCFSHVLSDDEAHMWNTMVTITSKKKTLGAPGFFRGSPPQTMHDSVSKGKNSHP